MAIKISELSAENVKRVRAVQLTPTENGLTVIGGDNGQGKTTVLDAIAWGLGGDRYRPSNAVRDGSTLPPHIKLTLSNGLVVERTGKNSALKITDPSGQKAGQQLLDSLIEKLALDLPRFMAASDSEKANTLLRIIGVGPKLNELDSKYKLLFNRRREIGRFADQKMKYAKELPFYADAPKEPISAYDLIQRQQAILANNGMNQRLRDRAAELRRRNEDLQHQLQELSRQYEASCAELSVAEKTASELVDESTAQLEDDLLNIERINVKVRANLDRENAETEAAELLHQYEELTAQLASISKERKDLLDGADLPLPELSVEDGTLTYREKAWDCMSASEQLKVSVAIIRKLNPQCGFVLMDKLEQMDLKTLQEFGEWAETEGLQIIATRVSTGAECSIIIEDGTNKVASLPPVIEKKWKAGEF